MRKNEPVEIVSADDDMVSAKLLTWSGLSDRWDRHSLGDLYDFTKDVAEHCEHISIEKKDWDAGMPGRSGVWHVVTTTSRSALKAEMRARVSEILRTDRDSIERYKRKLKADASREAKGPKSARLLFEADIWDDFNPTTYAVYLEEPTQASRMFRLWHRTNDFWRLCAISAPANVGAREAARAMVRQYLGPPGAAGVVSFKPGPVLFEEGLESLANEYQR